jgi:PAS domain S-box-containing protein
MKKAANMEVLRFVFPHEWTTAVLVLALMSTCMVISLFAYLNYRTKKPYFQLWIIAWMFYAVYLTAALGLEMSMESAVLVMARRACIGLSALTMFWGSFHLVGRPRSMRELEFGTGLITVWSGVAAFLVRDKFWITMPVFALLAGAGIFTGVTYFLRRRHYHGATILGVGFFLWGLHLLAFPYLEASAPLMTLGYLGSAVLATMITVGMIVEREVSSAEQTFRVLFDSSSDAIFLVDMLTLQIREANAAALRLTKFAAVDLVGKSFVAICPSLQLQGTIADNQTMLRGLLRPFSEFPMARGNGTTVNCEGDLAFVQWHQQPVLQINIRDVSDRKKVGQQLRRAEKLSALGQLIAGVAHELNNPLAVVAGIAQVMAKRPSLEDKNRDDIKRILHESERASKIVRDLLAFARPSDPRKTAIDLNRMIANILEVQETQIQAAGIKLETKLAKDLPKTMADLGQVEQVLVNIISNAIYALHSNPKPRLLNIATEDTGTAVRVSIADNGPGIPPEVVGHIFDPFFTTKPLGKGTGLGLTISNTIIQEHRGKILVESTPGAGAKFTVELPLLNCETATNPEHQPEADVGTPAADGHSILVVDDEPGIAEVMREVLTSIGHTVTLASNGNEAIEKINAGAFDLMLSDMRMPGMDGATLYQTLKKNNCPLAHRLIFVTGDTVSADTRAFLEETGNRWLSKPFAVQQVIDTVSEVLQKPHPRPSR